MKNFLQKGGLVIASLVGFMSVSHAAIDPAVDTALADAKTDSVAVAGSVLIILVAIAAFKYIKKTL
jgi:hypothetical protein